MRFHRLRIRTSMLIVAVIALILSYANQAVKRFEYCWLHQQMCRNSEAIVRGQLSSEMAKHLPLDEAVRQHILSCTKEIKYYNDLKWCYRIEAFLFWKPLMDETGRALRLRIPGGPERLVGIETSARTA